MRKNQFLGLTGAVAISAMLAAVGPTWAQQQSPSLDAAVSSGDLPAVAERLPANPLVVD